MKKSNKSEAANLLQNEKVNLENSKEERAAELIIANEEKAKREKELVIANADKAERAAELVIAEEQKEKRADELIIAKEEKTELANELVIANEEKAERAAELVIADAEKADRAAELVIANKEKAKRAAELVIANEEKEKRASELVIANAEKAKRAAELVIANAEKAKRAAVLVIANLEKEKRADELIIADKELVYQNEEKVKRAAELVIADVNKTKRAAELVIAKIEKAKRIAKSIIADKELSFQTEEKSKRAAELVIADAEKSKRAAELVIANIKKAKRSAELVIANVEKAKRSAELVIANKELVYQKSEKSKREAELIIANVEKAKRAAELVIANIEKSKRAAELVIANKELVLAKEKAKLVADLIIVNKELTHQIEKRKQTELALKETNEKYSEAFQSSPYSITISRLEDAGYIEVNDAFTSIFGFTREEATTNSTIGLDIWVNIEDQKWVTSTLLDGRNVSGKECLFKKKNGEIITGLFATRFISVNKEPYIISSINDITERKLAEKEMQKSEERLKLYMDNSPMAVVEWDSDFTVTRWTGGSEKIFGWKAEEVVGKQLMDLNITYEQDIPIVQKTGEKIKSGLFTQVFSCNRNYKKDGSIISCEWYNVILKDENGKMQSVLSKILDITERNQAEIELKESISSLRYAQKIAGMGSWEFDLINQNTKWSENLFILFGLKPFEIEPTFEYFKSRIHPNDLHLIDEVYENIIRTKEPESFEWRIIFPDGTFKWFGNQLIPIFQDEKLIALKGINLDITERKRIEEESIKQREILQRIIDNIPVMITYFDKNGKINMVNKELVRVLGWTLHEWKTENIFAKCYPEPEYLKEILDFMGSGKAGWIDIKTHTKYGTIIDTSWTNISLSDGVSMGIGQDITVRKKTEDSLRQSVALNETLLKTIPFGMDIVDETGTVLFANDNLRKILGKEAIGQKCWDLYHDDKKQCNDCPLIKGISVSESKVYETQGVFGNRIFEINHTGMIYQGQKAMLEIFQDITERKQIAESLQESERKYRELVENSPDAIIIYQKNKIVFTNSESLRLIGAEGRDDLSEKSVIEFVHPDSRALVIERMKKLQNIGTVLPPAEEKFVRFDGSEIDVEVKAMSIMFEGKSAVQLIIRNITERKQAELELLKAKEKAEESSRLKTAFLHNMSHEVRTPLNAIVGFSQLLVEPNQPSEQLKTFSDMISTSSEKLIEIITDVIEISKIQSNQIETKLTEIDIVSFISNIVNSFKDKAMEKNIALTLNQNIPNKEYVLSSDREKLKKIFNHLIDNAIKFTHKGSVEITCEVQKDSLKVLISDTGIGISEETQEIIFEPFRQLENELHRNYGGNGLGLPIVKAYTELLNGSISLKSEINKGTTVIVTIPINKPSVEPSKNLINETNYSRLVFGNDYPVNTILIAEDEYTNFRYLSELLNPLKIEIIHAINGQQAIDFCRNNNAIDLILMDIRMPIMDGQTAAKLIKAFRPNLPIIAQTAYATEDEKNKYLNIFDDYITKPINKDEFRQKIKKYFDK